ncbi:HWE histidine kinase domain-containing protein [Teichococcus oryzae]|uniref:histidine kinase n=1 Tax=Teichococcus oryzae TaxID=1608942 RepID=A0A5B2TD96_9PROT|nr:HWE histidine kinase domain-containing protein [Pseudoroseomonas oryzae]KAA2211760.1 HAMP domain-containing protein [Pseudoroseomonas oryzae]
MRESVPPHAAAPVPFRQFGLRQLLAFTMGGLGLAATLATALVLGARAERHLQQDIGAEFSLAAERLADLLDRSLAERMHEIQLLATLPIMRNAAAPEAERRLLLQEVHGRRGDYAILMLISPEGRVLTSSNGLLEGLAVAERGYFQAGRQGPFLGDLREAALLAPQFSQPTRMLDLAAPVRDAAGELVGVVAAQLLWGWADSLAGEALAPLRARRPDVTALLLSREGRALPGQGSRGDGEDQAGLAPEIAARVAEGWAGSVVVGTRLVGFAPARGHRHLARLGWAVLVRGDATAALARAGELRRRILGWGAVAALLAALLGWAVAGAVARPLQRLSKAALRLRRDATTPIPRDGCIREIATLADSLISLITTLRGREQELADGEARLRAVLEQMPVGVVLVQMPTGLLCFRNARALEILGRPLEPDTPLTLQTAFSGLRRDGLPYEADDFPIARALRLGETVVAESMLYRRGDGQLISLEMNAAPVRGTAGQSLLVVCTFEDVTEARMAAEQSRVLAREVDHRAKNALAVVQAALRMTRADTPEAFVHAVEGRVSALARAQIRLAEEEWRGVSLQALLEGELTALLGDRIDRSLEMEGPLLVLKVEAVQPISMMVHELASNAARHGALSSPGGRVTLRWHQAHDPVRATEVLHLHWTETDGPALSGPPARRGFGARVIETTARQQLGGMVHWEWRQAGLCCQLVVPIPRLVAEVTAD